MSEFKKEVSVQLYSVRAELEKDYEEIIRRIAGFGYKFVEPAGFPGCTLEKAAALYDELGIKALSMHGALPVGDDVNQAIETAKALGAEYIVSGKGPDDFKTADDVKRVAELFSEAATNAETHGIKIGYHNHYWEMDLLDGVPGYRIFMENTPDDVKMEIDTYWVKVGGLDPVEVITESGNRAPLIHMKDGDIEPRFPMKAVGYGAMDFPPIVEAAKFAELLVVELDACDTDMLEAVKSSYDYITSIV
ncbi:MAG: sugar phosphate isomerase/epimerase [Kiritimatiellaeota bacterium]|nr:sugar phosphate isomerase/epimerase [Kiritimatiellota bacterium]